jgi:hypothetical protein
MDALSIIMVAVWLLLCRRKQKRLAGGSAPPSATEMQDQDGDLTTR